MAFELTIPTSDGRLSASYHKICGYDLSINPITKDHYFSYEIVSYLNSDDRNSNATRPLNIIPNIFYATLTNEQVQTRLSNSDPSKRNFLVDLYDDALIRPIFLGAASI